MESLVGTMATHPAYPLLDRDLPYALQYFDQESYLWYLVVIRPRFLRCRISGMGIASSVHCRRALDLALSRVYGDCN